MPESKQGAERAKGLGQGGVNVPAKKMMKRNIDREEATQAVDIIKMSDGARLRIHEERLYGDGNLPESYWALKNHLSMRAGNSGTYSGTG